ncbi:MAG: hypothetical protein HN742_10275 [Lentisphaerae bacterium]|jgi:rhamnogalacturonan endolyase|nr:hypothetical protein [Lentisphaerota bacterium]MBT4822190.1 hypothetical protein [Lentisphaerota bacterium]MBT5610260.1 hypothetical protein [Lentisphaerota bacterium]MBT7059784.1 hypothetical protein [Lentisphaerota bacterium]MBT7842249.1 hypothetical protein [Lentisphaerota bacterium]
MAAKMILVGGLMLASGCVSFQPREIVRFEAEACTGPAEAWQENKFSHEKWNLWSTDVKANEKWSGGVVLQSPVVKEDRATGEEGAPVLHTVIEGLRNGTYDVCMNSTRAIGVSRDGETWFRSHGGVLFDDPIKIKDGRFELWFDDRYANQGGTGSCYVDYLDFRPALKRSSSVKVGSRTPSPEDYPPVQGWAKERREELLDRGVIALMTPRGAYVSWRLLKNDPPDVGFDVYRRVGDGPVKKLNRAPITATTDVIDRTAPRAGPGVVYTVLPAGVEAPALGASATLSALGAEASSAAYLSIKLNDERTRFQKVAFADLNGDGKLDYVIKHPNGNVDPWVSYWKRSDDTYKIEAYLHDGTYLWTRDLGWSIERGIWYSPYVVADLNGDGKAEIAIKTGRGDPREEDGKVRSGPEWLSIWNGMTGKRIARTLWPAREAFLGISHDYNYYSRNQLAVAYLDGKTPCVIALRGTYNIMMADAYQLKGRRLDSLWSYSNDRLAREYWGQGEHFTHAVDVDGDGRDEVMLGSVMLDDTGCPLWTTGLGHNDAAYVSDVLPDRPGLEVFYIIERRQSKHGMCLADARTGEIIWGHDKPTTHVHGAGMCADIDPLHPGMEGWGADSANHKIAGGPWLWAANGELLACADPTLPRTFSVETVFWDADLQKECLFSKSPSDFRGGPVDGVIAGSVVMVADILGDWREEIITSTPGELRIYSTTLPAMDRRVCLLQDPVYRADVRMDSMGYRKLPSLSYCPAAESPNVNLTLLPKTDDKRRRCRVVVSAPLNTALQGTLALSTGSTTFAVDLKPGELTSFEADVHGELPEKVPLTFLDATLSTAEGQLRTRVPVSIPKPPPGTYKSSLPRVEAEAFSGQGGGNVKVRADKANVSGRAFSHWDAAGHWLEWTLDLAEAGRYELVFRYCTPGKAIREVAIDGKGLGQLTLPGTGGFGDTKGDWLEQPFNTFPEAKVLRLQAGKHILRVTNVNDTAMNLDFIGFRKMP